MRQSSLELDDRPVSALKSVGFRQPTEENAELEKRAFRELVRYGQLSRVRLADREPLRQERPLPDSAGSVVGQSRGGS